MRFSKLTDLVAQSLRRHWLDFVTTGIGVVVGVASLFFFTGLGEGIKSFVLERLLVVRKLEVVAPSLTEKSGGLTDSLWGSDKEGLSNETVRKIRNLSGVADAYPKMKLTFPASLRGGKELIGKEMKAEFVGDGIPPKYLKKTEDELAFRDWGKKIDCSSETDCPAGSVCSGGVCRGRDCTPGTETACGEGLAYCNKSSQQCELPVPVVASPRLLEIYNNSVHTALGGASGFVSKLPKLSAKTLRGFEFTAVLGASMIGRSAKGKAVWKKLRLVGFSDKAIDVGATVPLGYVERWNKKWGPDGTDKQFHQIVVRVRNSQQVAEVARQITRDLGLDLSEDYRRARQASLMITILTIVFDLISALILVIAAIHITHTFSMLVLERRREIGLMRAVGATKWDIRAIIFGEATVLGLAAGLVGTGLGYGTGRLADYMLANVVGDFPFKPDAIFAFEPWMAAATLGVSLLFCWAGGAIPAIRASQIDPAETLAGR